MADHSIISMEPRNVETATEAMALAFMDDPLMEFMQPNKDKRMATGRWMFGSFMKYAMRWGVVDTVEGGKCAAIWLPPGGTTMPFLRIARTPLIQFPFRLGFRGMMRFNSVMGTTEKAHKRLMPDPHWYLAGIAVHPDLQGTGVGSALMNHGHARADAGKHAVYLETATQADIDFYSKRGYEIRDRMELSGLKATLMSRPVQG